ncbi:MAG: hypothetical protein NTW87_33940 [Planctomycetota bacterium]|nr:hypothetical protein [Planctomycetota bacterium]
MLEPPRLIRARDCAMALLAFALACAPVRADTVVLNNGKSIEGEVVADKDDVVVIKTDAGTLTFKKDSVKEIKKAPPPGEKQKAAPDGRMTREERAAAVGLGADKLHEAGEKQVDCPVCKGTGVAIWLPCNRCRGAGQVKLELANRVEKCERCEGKGKIAGAYCLTCDKRGKVYLSQLTPSQGGTKKPPPDHSWCTQCNGTGVDAWEDCLQCLRSQWRGYTYHGEYLDRCNRCMGAGKIAKHLCAACRGTGLISAKGDASSQFVQPLTGVPTKK